MDRRLGPRRNLRAVRRTDHSVLPWRSQRDGDHVARHEVFAANAEVEALLDDIGLIAFGDEIADGDHLLVWIDSDKIADHVGIMGFVKMVDMQETLVD